MIKKLLLSLLLVFSAQGVILRNGIDVSQDSIDKVWEFVQHLYKDSMYKTLADLSNSAKNNSPIEYAGIVFKGRRVSNIPDNSFYIQMPVKFNNEKTRYGMNRQRIAMGKKHDEAIQEMILLGICDKNRVLTSDAINIIKSSIYNLSYEDKTQAVMSCSIQHPVSFTKRLKINFKNVFYKK
ncbi:MAG: hypothetical protein P4L22_01570 [Candidatus Babeliales bacterium]|nr:hypothetical protein [Candidatus Babeliales bacterium]